MRSGFVFNEDEHATLDNIKKTITINATGNTITVSDATKTFTRIAGSFIADGFIVSNKITTTNFTNANNNDTWLISALTATVMTVTTTAGGTPTLTDETNITVADLTWASNDELATGFGYKQDSKNSGQITLAKDNANNRLNATFPSTTWTASGGSMGPSAGSLYRIKGQDNTIIGFLAFDVEEIATDGTVFHIGNQSFGIA